MIMNFILNLTTGEKKMLSDRLIESGYSYASEFSPETRQRFVKEAKLGEFIEKNGVMMVRMQPSDIPVT